MHALKGCQNAGVSPEVLLVGLRPFLARQMLWMWAGKVFRTAWVGRDW